MLQHRRFLASGSAVVVSVWFLTELKAGMVKVSAVPYAGAPAGTSASQSGCSVSDTFMVN
jgi:hypothetical protein